MFISLNTAQFTSLRNVYIKIEIVIGNFGANRLSIRRSFECNNVIQQLASKSRPNNKWAMENCNRRESIGKTKAQA